MANRRARPVEQPRDVVGLMLAAGMDDRQVRDELVTFVVAGHETVASSLTWTLDLLARHPAVLERVHAELAVALGRARTRLGRPGGRCRCCGPSWTSRCGSTRRPGS